jgi:hypothetical protein
MRDFCGRTLIIEHNVFPTGFATLVASNHERVFLFVLRCFCHFDKSKSDLPGPRHSRATRSALEERKSNSSSNVRRFVQSGKHHYGDKNQSNVTDGIRITHKLSYLSFESFLNSLLNNKLFLLL